MDKISYHKGNTFLHRLYPLTKFSWLIIASILMFIVSSGILLFFLAAMLMLFLLMINPRIMRIRGFRLVFVTGLILLLLHVLFNKSGSYILQSEINLFSLTTGGINAGMRISGRFLTIVFLSYLFILSTDPNHLAYSIMKTGIPYRYGFMVVTALRLAPLMEDEGQIIYRAQLTRGVHYDRLSCGKLILIVRNFLTPLLFRAMRRADKLYFSLEGRSFGRYPKRTFRSHSDPSSLDLSFSIILFIGFLILLFMNFKGVNLP